MTSIMYRTTVAAALLVLMLVGFTTAATIDIDVMSSADGGMISDVNILQQRIVPYVACEGDDFTEMTMGEKTQTQSYASTVAGLGALQFELSAKNVNGDLTTARSVGLMAPGFVYADEAMGIDTFSPIEGNCNLCYGDQVNCEEAMAQAMSRLIINQGTFTSRASGLVEYSYAGQGNGIVTTGMSGYSLNGVVDCWDNSVKYVGSSNVNAKFTTMGNYNIAGSMKYYVG